ncbi:MAG: hypothetical protein M1819_006713 [Sarea resinae]|nr:MAG: hypothetical protein M1819_006713 [Sarea resinae]
MDLPLGSDAPKNIRLEKFEMLRDRLRGRRMDAIGTRLKAHEMRNALRRKREIASDADAKLMKALNSHFATKLPDDSSALYTLFEDCRQARESYNPLEIEYNQLEDRLDLEEYDVVQEENRFYDKYGGIYSNGSSNFADHEDYGGSIVSESTASTEPALDYPPILIQYLSRLGDADMIKERLDDLLHEQAECLEVESVRRRFGASPSSANKQFLQEFNEMHTKVLAEMEAVRSDVRQLEQEALKQGVLTVTEHFHDESDSEQLTLESTASGTRMDPLLLAEDEKGVFDTLIEHDTNDPISTRKRINLWLLHVMRSSQLEIDRYRANKHLGDTSLDDETWTRMVLETWSEDDDAMASVSSISSSGGPTSTHSS